MGLPDGIDPACLNLCKAMNELPGICTTESCCGHGKSDFHVFFKMLTPSLGATALARCLSGRYNCYKPGELRADPIWHVRIADSDYGCSFLLVGKPMEADGPCYKPAELLASNIMRLVEDDFALVKRIMEDT